MFSKTTINQIILVCSLSVLIAANNVAKIEDRLKRSSDIDLQTCIDNFNVHRDKIIRTQDSQNMGAKYLSEIDLGSREECLRLCCETDNCDVFVFEEKVIAIYVARPEDWSLQGESKLSPVSFRIPVKGTIYKSWNSGSCYLFHCGPPEDFKCKFTHHVNYSSAVLSINRHMPDLESQIKLTKHEQDLTKLRKQEVESETEGTKFAAVEAIKPTPLTSTTPVMTKEVIPVLGKGKLPEEVPGHKCSRFQFPCRSTGDCIAIYNACDGIPQCADGSDEGPECPPDATTAPPPPSIVVTPRRRVDSVLPQPQGGLDSPNNAVIPQQKLNPVLLPNNPPSPHYRPHQPPQPQQLIPDIHLPPQPDSEFIRQMSDPLGNHRPPYQEPQQPLYIPQVPQQGQGIWIPHQESQLQGPIQGQTMQQYPGKPGPIYNHKDALNNQDMSQLQYTGAVNAKIPGSFYGENYRQPVQEENWPIDDRYNPQPRYQQQNFPKTQDNFRQPEAPDAYKPAPIAKQSDSNTIKITEVNPKNVQEKLAHDLKHSKDSMDHGSNAETKIKTQVTFKHHQEYPDVVAYKISDDSQDGISEVPRGAILSLTLGLIITCVMAILIGCRVRVVRRRLRKGGKSYAHDADYLVNGMYL